MRFGGRRSALGARTVDCDRRLKTVTVDRDCRPQTADRRLC
jgi:hypothetical protein